MEELRTCIEQALAPNTAPATREAANRRLTTLQNDPSTIALCLDAFAHPTAVHPNTLSFLLNVAKTQVLMFHQQWPEAIRVQFREAMRQCYTMPMFCGQARTSEKVAAILVEVAVREWPQLWSDAFDYVYGLLSVRVDLGLLFMSTFIMRLRSEADESQCGGWSVERKAELSQAFNEVLPGFITWFHQNLHSSTSPLMIKIYGQLCGWAKIDRHEVLVDWCFGTLQSANVQLRDDAMEAFGELANRQFNVFNEEDCRLIHYLMGDGLTRINGLLEAAVGGDYFFFRQLVDAITMLLSRLSVSEKLEAAVKDKVYSAVMDLQLYLSHPSLYVRSSLVMCLLDVFRTTATVSGMLQEAIDQCMPLLMAILAEDPKKTFKCADNQNDFDEFTDFVKVGEHLRSRIGELFAAFSRASRAQMRNIILQQSNKWLCAGAPTASHNKWQMAVLFLIQTASGDTKEDSSSSELEEVYNMVVQLLHSNQHAQDDKLVEEALYGCKALCLAIADAPIYRQSFAVFQHFACLPGDGSLQVRCRSMAALHQMALNNQKLFADQLMTEYVKMSSQLRGQRELRTWIETTLWMATADGVMNMEYVKAVFVPLLAQLESLDCVRRMDGHHFAEYIGLPYYLNSNNTTTGESEVCKNNRLLLVNLFTLLQVTSKAIKDVTGELQKVVLEVIVPLVLLVVGLLNQMQTLCVSHPLYEALYGDLPTDVEESNDFVYINRWLSHLRTVCHMIIGYSAKHVANLDLHQLAVTFNIMSSTDKCSLVRNAVAPIARHTHGRDSLTVYTVSVCVCWIVENTRVFDDHGQEDAEKRQKFVDVCAAFSWLICDVIKKGTVMTADIVKVSPTILRHGNTVKWCSYLSENLQDLVKDQERSVFHDLTNNVIFLALDDQFTSKQANLLQLLFDLFKWNVWMGFHQVDHLLCQTARVNSDSLDSCRQLLLLLNKETAGNNKKLRDAKAAFTASLKPSLPNNNSASTVKKLVPEKLVILSKLRRQVEAEQVENEAIASAADLFD